jgi:hypothetical protein
MLDGSLIEEFRPNDPRLESAQAMLTDGDGQLIDRSLRLADDQEVVRQMAYVLRSWPRARSGRRGDDALARVTAERLVDYLHLSGFELMKRPVATDTGYIGGGL